MISFHRQTKRLSVCLCYVSYINHYRISFRSFVACCFLAYLLFLFLFSCLPDDEENLVDEGAEDFKPSEPQSKAEARGLKPSIFFFFFLI